MKDNETLAVYADNVEKYASMVESEKPGKTLKSFLNEVAEGGTILDLGCGPGNSSAHMLAMGFDVVATDASPEMVQIAKETHGVEANIATFDDLEDVNRFDGIWANFSLLHAPKSAFPNYLSAIYKALKPNGVFHIGMKLGTGEKRDALGRFYAYYSIEELELLLNKCGLVPFSRLEGEEEGLDGTIAPWVTILSSKAK